MNKTNYAAASFYIFLLIARLTNRSMVVTKPFLQSFLELFLNTCLSRTRKLQWDIHCRREHIYLLLLDCLEKFGTALKCFLTKPQILFMGGGFVFFSAYLLVGVVRWLSRTFPALICRTYIYWPDTLEAQARPCYAWQNNLGEICWYLKTHAVNSHDTETSGRSSVWCEQQKTTTYWCLHVYSAMKLNTIRVEKCKSN